MEAIMAPELHLQPSGAVVAAPKPRPKLHVVDDDRKWRRKHRRFNSQARSNRHIPRGFYACTNPSCTKLVSVKDFRDGVAFCPVGHPYDEAETEQLQKFNENLKAPRWASCGLSRTHFGRLCEQILYELGSLGDFGEIIGRWEDKPSKGELDFVTTAGFGGECKGADGGASVVAFCLGRDEKESKTKFCFDHDLTPLGALVVPDFVTSLAEIYLRSWPDRFKYFARPRRQPPNAIHDFRHLNPFLPQEEKVTEPMPF